MASTSHRGALSNPRAAALQGLTKMRFVRDLGVAQAVLPPHDRPSLASLRSLGFRGSDEEVIAAGFADGGLYLRVCSSASAMWAANAATMAPSCDTADGRAHFTVANLQHMFHRSIEARTTARILRRIFADPAHFVVHDPLPGGGQLADEGAANHIRLATSSGAAHIFAWGRSSWPEEGVEDSALVRPGRHPARQTREASAALARLHRLDRENCFFPQQHPLGIDAGAFHSDVMAVGSGRFFMLHELAFVGDTQLVDALRGVLGDELFVVRATSDELPPASAVAAYPFNSQVVTVAGGTMAIIAPEDAREDPPSRAFLERVIAAGGPVRALHYVNVRQSMQNGGGPACLRLRVLLSDEEARSISANVVLSDSLCDALEAWILRHYRDRLAPDDLADPELAREGMRALDELTSLLDLGSIYDFQQV
jgi:succinylarginine dihydrolase